MGLDMYAYTAPAELVGERKTDVELVDSGGGSLPGLNRDFAYWRKCYSLHRWMEDLYRRKGGTDVVFNLNTVVVEPQDLFELERAVENGGIDSAERGAVLDFVERARAAHLQGLAVIYDSWW